MLNGAEHVIGLLLIGFIIAPPLPLSLAFSFVHTAGRPAPPSHIAVIVAVAWLSIQTSVALMLGVVGRLTLGHVLVVDLLLCCLGVMTVVRCRIPLSIVRPVWHLSRAEVAIVACVSSIGAWLLYQTAISPPSEYDTLAYRLPAVANWYRTATLDMLGQGNVDFYPYHFELLAAVFVLPLHDLFAIGLAADPCLVLFGLAIYVTARLLGARRLPALACALHPCVPPLVLRLATTTLQVDLAFAASFLLTLYLALASVFRRRHWSVAALSAAWLVGTKTSGLGYIWVLAVASVVARLTFADQLAAPATTGPRRPAIAVVLTSLLVCVINAGFWYGRNVMTSGNPLGPVGVTVLGLPILHGPMTASEHSRSSLAAVFRIEESRTGSLF